jgi:hypothetical protein
MLNLCYYKDVLIVLIASCVSNDITGGGTLMKTVHKSSINISIHITKTVEDLCSVYFSPALF